jgi:hypothetical protein
MEHAGVAPVVRRRILAVMLGGLSLLGPLSIDVYLPAFADIQRDFQANTADLQPTLTGYLLAFACMSLVRFESVSLQRRVSGELGPGSTSTRWL